MRPQQNSVDPRLRAWIDQLDSETWAAVVLDADDVVVWMSTEFKAFLQEDDDAKAGVGAHVAQALLSEPWQRTISPASSTILLETALPFVAATAPGGLAALARTAPEPHAAAVAAAEPVDPPALWTGAFDYVADDGLPVHRVQFLAARLRDESGTSVGSVITTHVAMRPTLLSLLARGDERLYSRMAALVQPSRHHAAILFADLQQSGDVSRRLPTTLYFDLIRHITCDFDELVAVNGGVVGGHAGDGMTAFFIADAPTDAAAGAVGAVRVARGLHERVATRVLDVVAGTASEETRIDVNIGLHWGSGLLMGQLVPGSRLDVTALGDEVNECARIQQTARDGQALASKALLEMLDPADAAELGLDDHSVAYRPLGELSAASEKARRDAGTLPVADV